MENSRWHHCAVLWIPLGTETRPRWSHCLLLLQFPSLPFSLSVGAQYTPIYLPQASAVSPSVYTSATTAQSMARLRPEQPVSAAHLCVFLLTASAWMAQPESVRGDSGALKRRAEVDLTLDTGAGHGGFPPGSAKEGDEESASAESSPRFRRALSREKQMSLVSSSFVLKGDATHNQAMVHWTGENSSVSSLSSLPVPLQPAGSCIIPAIPGLSPCTSITSASGTSYCSRGEAANAADAHRASLGEEEEAWRGFYAPRWSPRTRSGCYQATRFAETSGLWVSGAKNRPLHHMLVQGHERLVVVSTLRVEWNWLLSGLCVEVPSYVR